MRNEKEHIAAQPVSIEVFLNIVHPVVTDQTAFVLVSTNRLISIYSDGKRVFDSK